MLDIDSAIKHCLEVAEQNEISAITYKNCKEIKTNMYEKLTAEKAENDCRECAADHRQLAEWLMEYKDLKAEQNDQYVFIHELMSELKEAKQLLKSVIDEWHIVCEWGNCGEYCGWYKNGKCTQEWSGKSKALKLIGETNVDQ